MEKIELEVFEDFSRNNYRRWIIPLVDDALKEANLKAGLILDVGCGPGLLAKELASRSNKLQIVGIDVSPYAIKLAKKNCSNLRNTIFKVGNVDKLPFADASFDLVICKDSLHHFDDPKIALQNMCHILKKSGILYIQDLRRDLPMYLLKRAIPPDTVFKKLQFYSARASYTKKEVRTILSSLHIRKYTIRTRNLTRSAKRRYRANGIDIQQLKESLQARYTLVVKMSGS